MWVLPYSGGGSIESAGLWKTPPLTQKKAKKMCEMYGGPAEIRTQDLRRVKALFDDNNQSAGVNIPLCLQRGAPAQL